MSENPLQLLFQAFDKVSECIQSHLSQFVLRPGGPSSSFSTNQNQILSLSSPSTAASHLQPAEFLVKVALLFSHTLINIVLNYVIDILLFAAY
ncbi:fad-linked sulfhydryl oxidase erv1 [Phtheirospermum japonicum]|uniref:Fad-linked sulfhydryl oxidase erv1 n=1 Tax=Phtheirospermum japonicum TaxID=374723 RepID=A0A830CHY7_9LAMI|nr:fad-linked sulfhydryl oxidase erv1 [Phtheirospermum japonicum]